VIRFRKQGIGAVARKGVVALAAATLLGGCTWVHMAPGASAVQVMASPPAGCEKRGEVEVAVKHSIAFIDRNALRVREELETLARNEAPGLGANVIHPLGDPSRGTQRFAAWRCAR
jgi:hypothetical protein